MLVREAQQDIARAYVGGGPGLFFSALIWLAAGLIEQQHGIRTAFSVLFVGGMFIYPAGLFLSRVVFRRPAEAKTNPIAGAVLECTAAMIAGLFAAWLFLPYKPEYVFPLAALAVGTHFGVFKTVYGDRLFWLLAAAVSAIGLVDILVMPVRPSVAFAVAATEATFALILTLRGLART